MSFGVLLSCEAEEDLLRLEEFLVQRASSMEDLLDAAALMRSLREAICAQLAASPWSYRKAGDGHRSTRREFIFSTGAAGYVALYEIDSADTVVVLAVRHQREDDFH